jgi:AGZA family xanthine/uracil permease-like MFS transporter
MLRAMADRPDAAPAARWIAPGDLGAFFALALDNLTNLVLLASILVGGFGFPADVFATRMVPGTALGVMVGDLAYTWMAMRLRHATGRADITAMPLGLDTPSTVGMAVAVLGPTWLATHDAMLTWHVGMAVMVLMAVVKTAAAFAGDWIRRVAPQAGLLGSIGGVGVALLGVLPLLHLFEAPIAGLAALGVVLYALIAGLGLPRRIPGALAAVVLGTALYYALGAAGEQPGFHWPTWHLQAAAPVPTLGFLDGLERAIDFLPLALPFALLTVVGGINVTESARAAGDDYRTRDVLLVEAGATLVAGLTGGVAQSTPYIGHPAYKRMGARAGYTLLAGLFVGIGGVLGIVQFLTEAIPAAAIAPLLLFVGVEIVSQAFDVPPRPRRPVVLAMLPSIAELGRILCDGDRRRGTAGRAATAHTLDVIAHGFIVTGLVWARRRRADRSPAGAGRGVVRGRRRAGRDRPHPLDLAQRRCTGRGTPAPQSLTSPARTSRWARCASPPPAAARRCRRQRPRRSRLRRAQRQLVERPDRRVAVPGRDRRVARPHRQHRVHPGRRRGGELGHHVGHERDPRRRQRQRGGDRRVAGRRLLGAGGGVEVRRQVRGQVAAIRVRIDQPLRRDRARRVAGDRHAGGAPRHERRPDVGVQLAAQRAGQVAVVPDQALQRLEPGRLAIARHQRPRVGDQIGRRHLAIGGPLGGQRRQRRRHRGLGAARRDELVEPRRRVREQHVVDERDRRGRALDVEHHRGDGQRDGHGIDATSASPRHSGW